MKVKVGFTRCRHKRAPWTGVRCLKTLFWRLVERWSSDLCHWLTCSACKCDHLITVNNHPKPSQSSTHFSVTSQYYFIQCYDNLKMWQTHTNTHAQFLIFLRGMTAPQPLPQSALQMPMNCMVFYGNSNVALYAMTICMVEIRDVKFVFFSKFELHCKNRILFELHLGVW